jgi:hypothetical protein
VRFRSCTSPSWSSSTARTESIGATLLEAHAMVAALIVVFYCAFRLRINLRSADLA